MSNPEQDPGSMYGQIDYASDYKFELAEKEKKTGGADEISEAGKIYEAAKLRDNQKRIDEENMRQARFAHSKATNGNE